MKITVGADPELFLINGDGKFISSIGLIGGSKKHPLDIGRGCALQEDNVAVEFNIAPADSAEKFVNSINYALRVLTKRAVGMGLALSITASKSFDEDQLENGRARVFGCDPDFNCWTGKENKPPHSKDHTLRTTGGHVHIGTKDIDRLQLARWCDVKLGLNSVVEDDIPGSLQRRALYGKAGAFRPKSYGVEYRVLSPYWLSTNELMKKVYHRACSAVTAVKSGFELLESDGKKIQEAINNSNKSLAYELLTYYDGVK